MLAVYCGYRLIDSDDCWNLVFLSFHSGYGAAKEGMAMPSCAVLVDQLVLNGLNFRVSCIQGTGQETVS